MSKDLKNKVDSIRRSLKNNGLEVSATVIEMKILEMYPNYETNWNSTTRAEVVKSVTNDHKLSQTATAIAPVVNAPPSIQPLTQLQESETFIEEELEDEEVSAIEDEEVNAMPTAVNYAPLDIDQAGELATIEDKSELVASTAVSFC
ncbi:MAG: hypothetical protein HWQ38_00015 [Nostoc sp. NMS7]|uniref:hypothetical protein n=1 Tax=Nostoc sp. NMS7 TaxID=2815391 RepID=UPI0025F1D6EB|nr:hypothetical protein [Nostoc sp. NMS7]MBN3944950.1 hypothetical protein [Nostoc sp. NMS7]